MSSGHGNQQVRTSKLRSSCNACAEAKIGCTKEKPTCARCARRNERCIYATARRAGRPNHNKSAAAIHGASQQHINTAMTTPFVPPSPVLTPSSFENFLPDYSDLFESMSSFAELTPPSGIPSTNRDDLDAFLATMCPPSTTLEQLQATTDASHSLEKESEVGLSGPSSTIFDTEFFQDDDNNTHNPSLEDSYRGDREAQNPNHREDMDSSCSHFFPAITQSATSSTPPSSLNWFLSSYSTETSDSLVSISDAPAMDRSASLSSLRYHDPEPSFCGCLIRSSGLLSQLTPVNLAATCKQSSPSSISQDEPLSFEGVMEQNEATIAAISEILGCACSDDSSLLFILSLLVFKTLGWYAASASAVANDSEISNATTVDVTASSSDRLATRIAVRPPSSAKIYGYDDLETETYQGRIIYHVVLSKLNKVQRVVNLLSKRLLAVGEQGQRKQVGKKSSSTSYGGSGEDRLAVAAQDLLFHSGMFDFYSNTSASGGVWKCLENGLRLRLREVSRSIVEALQKG